MKIWKSANQYAYRSVRKLSLIRNKVRRRITDFEGARNKGTFNFKCIQLARLTSDSTLNLLRPLKLKHVVTISFVIRYVFATIDLHGIGKTEIADLLYRSIGNIHSDIPSYTPEQRLSRPMSMVGTTVPKFRDLVLA